MHGSAARAAVALVAALALALSTLAATPAHAKKKTRGKVRYGDTSWVAGADTGYRVTGRVSGGKGRTVRLQVRWADGYHTLDRDRTNRRGKFRLADSFNWYGAHRLRVKVSPTKRRRGKTFKPKEFRVDTGWTSRGERSAHEFFTYDDKKFAWNPCETINYRINPGRAGDRAIAFTQEAVERMLRGTGFDAKYVGRTDLVPIRQPNYPRGTDLIIAWSHQDTDPGLEGAVGVGGFQSGRLAVRKAAKRRKLWMIQRPGVTMNMAYAGAYPFAYADDETEPMGLVLIHELGHAMGLAHIADGIQVMHPGDRPARPDGYRAVWENGDLAGLRKVGADPGCMKKVRVRGRGGSVTPSAPGVMVE